MIEQQEGDQVGSAVNQAVADIIQKQRRAMRLPKIEFNIRQDWEQVTEDHKEKQFYFQVSMSFT